MKPIYLIVLATFLPLAAVAQAQLAPGPAGEVVQAQLVPLAAADVVLEDLKYISRPVVVFADSPDDPNFIRQMQLLARDTADLIERDVVVITDTDPAARTAIRLRLRPRGFSLVLMDKDLTAILRKPLPWNVREITHAIDKFPLRRQEMLEQRPAGR
ncbi:MAG: DUF4174 domain-containing protein [Gemmobacter sp.]|nr:DUF4174 domain-containing protein [Gemmobacter sp.]